MNVPLVQGTGLTKRKLRRPGIKGSKHSTTKGNNSGKPPKVVSYCPECTYRCFSGLEPNLFNKRHPHTAPQVPARDAREGRCKNKHVWTIGGKSRPSDQEAANG